MNRFVRLGCWVLLFGCVGLALSANAVPQARGMMRAVGVQHATMFSQKPDDPAITDGRIVFFSGRQNVTSDYWFDEKSQWTVHASNPAGIIVTNYAVWFKSSYYNGVVPEVVSNALASANFSILVEVDELLNGPARTVFSVRTDRKSEFALSLKGGGNGRLALDVAGKTCLNVKVNPSARVFLLSVENGVATVYADGNPAEGSAPKSIPSIVIPQTTPFAIGGDFTASELKVRTLTFYSKPKTADEATIICEHLLMAW